MVSQVSNTTMGLKTVRRSGIQPPPPLRFGLSANEGDTPASNSPGQFPEEQAQSVLNSSNWLKFKIAFFQTLIPALTSVFYVAGPGAPVGIGLAVLSGKMARKIKRKALEKAGLNTDINIDREKLDGFVQRLQGFAGSKSGQEESSVNDVLGAGADMLNLRRWRDFMPIFNPVMQGLKGSAFLQKFALAQSAFKWYDKINANPAILKTLPFFKYLGGVAKGLSINMRVAEVDKWSQVPRAVAEGWFTFVLGPYKELYKGFKSGWGALFGGNKQKADSR